MVVTLVEAAANPFAAVSAALALLLVPDDAVCWSPAATADQQAADADAVVVVTTDAPADALRPISSSVPSPTLVLLLSLFDGDEQTDGNCVCALTFRMADVVAGKDSTPVLGGFSTPLSWFPPARRPSLLAELDLPQRRHLRICCLLSTRYNKAYTDLHRRGQDAYGSRAWNTCERLNFHVEQRITAFNSFHIY